MSVLYKIYSCIRFGGFSFLQARYSKFFGNRGVNNSVLEKKMFYDKCRMLDENEYRNALKAIYGFKVGDRLNLDKPKLFNEKIQYLKLYDNTELKSILTDKLAVKEWVSQRIGEEYVIPTIKSWSSIDEIDFEELPNKFVVKANHGCGMNYIVNDSSKRDANTVKKMCEDWVTINYAYVMGLELQYKSIIPTIFAEEYIEEMNGNLLDYKIHCFNGEPMLVQVIGDRDLQSHYAKEAFYDIEWNRNNDMYNTYVQYEYDLEKPHNLDELLDVSRRLARGFKYVRVDLYDLDGRIKFGEMTFTPYGGYGKWKNKKANRKWGEMINCT